MDTTIGAQIRHEFTTTTTTKQKGQWTKHSRARRSTSVIRTQMPSVPLDRFADASVLPRICAGIPFSIVTLSGYRVSPLIALGLFLAGVSFRGGKGWA